VLGGGAGEAGRRITERGPAEDKRGHYCELEGDCFEEDVVVGSWTRGFVVVSECVWFPGNPQTGLTLWLTGLSYPVLPASAANALLLLLLPRVSSESSRRRR
jgi:hypothetical protein